MEGKITLVEQIKNKDGNPFKDKNDNSYFDVDIDTTKGYVCAKTQWFKVGDTVEYTVEERKGKKDRWQWRIHLTKPQPQDNSIGEDGQAKGLKNLDEAALYRAAEKAVESSSVSLSGQAATTEKILDRADEIFTWITGRVKKVKEGLSTNNSPEENAE